MVGAGAASYYLFYSNTPCQPLGGAKQLRSTLGSATFGAVTEYPLPEPLRLSNAIAVAQDGSVWFGEQSVPGVGHFYPSNGTLVEYAWPPAPNAGSKECGFRTSIWGVAIWNGRIWGANADYDSLVGIDPSDGSTMVLNVSGTPFPYVFAQAPDGSLWFTSLSSPAQLGRVSTDYTVSAIAVTGLNGEEPIQLQFFNATTAYLVALNPAKGTGGVYEFDPRSVANGVAATPVGAGFKLFSPNSLTIGSGTIWVTQHVAASIAAYGQGRASWTVYPTSLVSYATTTLPYFVVANGTSVWFNEHYGNRIAVVDEAGGTLTEYSEADPPISNGSQIQNDLTIALAENGVWFTSTSGNYLGFVDATKGQGFRVLPAADNHSALAAGGRIKFQLAVEGTWSKALNVSVSDSELISSIPRRINILPNVTSIASGSGSVRVEVDVTAAADLPPGDYTLAVTVSDGLVLRTVYFFVTVA